MIAIFRISTQIFWVLLFLVQAAGCGCMENVLGWKDLPVKDSSADEDTAEFIDDRIGDDTTGEDTSADDDTAGEECESNAACDDGEPCNGQEFCSIDGHCLSGTPLRNGIVCALDPRSICLAGLCQVSICGDGYIDTGVGEQCDDTNLIPGDGCDNDCTYTCTAATQAEDCSDGLTCTFLRQPAGGRLVPHRGDVLRGRRKQSDRLVPVVPEHGQLHDMDGQDAKTG
jgi:cysteine-rich repeat protein